MQALYAFFQSNDNRIDIAEKNMLHRIDGIYDLYLYQLLLLVEITNFFRNKMEEAKHKYLPTSEDLSPNTKIVNNKFIKQLENNAEFLSNIKSKKISFKEEQSLIRKTYLKIKKSKEYLEYLKSSDNMYDSDKDIITKLFKKFILNSSDLRYFFEEKNIYWANDYDTASIMVFKTFKSFDKNSDKNTHLVNLYKTSDEKNVEEDKDFIIQLFRKTILHNKEYENMISEKVKNWKIERIAVIDVLLMKMALCEILEFLSIPVKVSLDEYIEISKLYSTPKSKIFINGILDKLITELTGNNKIKKTGRGLMK
jgi:N utilization substance protein B